jgi:amidase
MELLWESVVLGGDRGGGFEQDLQAIGATDPSEELAEFLRQAREVDFSLSEARRRFVAIDEYRIEMLTFMADYDVIICPAMPTPAHNLTGWPAAVVRCGTSTEGLPVGVQIVARPWQDATALAIAGYLEKVFGGWRAPPPVAA